MSVEEYLQLDRSSIEKRYEYIDGYATMLSGGTLDHAAIGANVISIFHILFLGSEDRQVGAIQQGRGRDQSVPTSL